VIFRFRVSLIPCLTISLIPLIILLIYMKNIYLTGFMGTGKTTVGKILARKLGKEFIETDALIEQEQGKKIVDIFSDKGEGYFRGLENRLIKELASKKDLVISCGGGLICNEVNLELLKKTGVVFSLMARSEVIYERTKKYTHRPLLNVDKPLEKIEELLEKRKPYYLKAHYVIDTEDFSPQKVADKIVGILSHGEKRFNFA